MFALDVYDSNPIYDAHILADVITRFIRRRRVKPSIDRASMVRRIQKYIAACIRWGSINVAVDRKQILDWSSSDEEIWYDWVYSRFLPWDWDTEVMERAFGSDRRAWEPAGWREGLFEVVISQWLQASIDIVEKYDPYPRPSDERDESDEIDADY